jgi:hypothetical protein
LGRESFTLIDDVHRLVTNLLGSSSDVVALVMASLTQNSWIFLSPSIEALVLGESFHRALLYRIQSAATPPDREIIVGVLAQFVRRDSISPALFLERYIDAVFATAPAWAQEPALVAEIVSIVRRVTTRHPLAFWPKVVAAGWLRAATALLSRRTGPMHPVWKHVADLWLDALSFTPVRAWTGLFSSLLILICSIFRDLQRCSPH